MKHPVEQSNYIVEEIYAYKNLVSMKKRNKIGEWSLETGFTVTEQSDLWQRRSNLNGYPLRTTFSKNGLTGKELTFDEESGGLLEKGGKISDIFFALRDICNFSVEYYPTPDGFYGREISPGRWNGMIGVLMEDKADVAVGYIAITKERSEVVDFSVSIDEAITDVIIPTTVFANFDFWAYIKLFNFRAWVVLGLMIALLTAGLYKEFGLVKSLNIFLLGLMQLEYFGENPKRKSVKMIIFIGFLFGFMIFQFFTAHLTSLMTFPTPTQPIKRFKDINTLGYKVMVFKQSATHAALMNADPDSSFGLIYKDNFDENFSPQIERREIIKQLKINPQSVHIGQFSPFYDDLVKEVMPLKVEDRTVINVAFPFRRDSELLQLFNYHLLKLDESGVLHKLHLDYGVKPQQTANAGQFLILGFQNLIFLFSIIFIGILAAIGVMCYEKLTHTMNHSAFITHR